MLVSIYFALRDFSSCRFLDFHLASKASIQLLTELKVKTEAKAEAKAIDLAVPCMKASLSLVLYTTQKVYDTQSDDNFADYRPRLSVQQNIMANLQQKLSEWISAVLGEIKVKKPKLEIKVSRVPFFCI